MSKETRSVHRAVGLTMSGIHMDHKHVPNMHNESICLNSGFSFRCSKAHFSLLVLS